MIGCRAIVGLSLLCALVVCVVAASSASAKGTTAFTCAKVAPKSEFADAHCDSATGGEYGHVEIKPGTTTEIELSNENTKNKTTEAEPSILTGLLGGVQLQILCQTVNGTGSLTNEEVKGKMQFAGNATINHENCKVTKPLKEGNEVCQVVKPIVYNSKFESKILSESPEEMSIEFFPKEGKGVFSEFTLENHPPFKCSIAGTIPIEGAFTGTPGGTTNGKGATVWFAAAEKLFWGKSPYTLTGAITFRMKEEGGVKQNAISFTTTAN